MPISEVFNVDCISYMQTLPDKFFDLAIVDPPYGIGEDGESNHSRSGIAKSKKYTAKKWDKEPPTKDYFIQLLRVSNRVIIWGANHFIENIPKANSSCWVVWDKENGNNDFADCELAYTNFETAVRKFKFKWHGMLQGDMKNKEKRIHPTQKPIALYKWLIEKYAKAGDKIFDSHMGSQSSRIATFNMGFDYWGCELDEEYFNDGNKRFIRETMQQSLFTPTIAKTETFQTTIF